MTITFSLNLNDRYYYQNNIQCTKLYLHAIYFVKLISKPWTLFFRWTYYDIFNIWRFQFSIQKDECNSICKFITNSACPSSIADSMSTRVSITHDADVLICRYVVVNTPCYISTLARLLQMIWFWIVHRHNDLRNCLSYHRT